MAFFIPVIKIIDTPILIGFQWSYGFGFAVRSQGVQTHVDLDLYDVKFALQQGSNKVTPTITSYAEGWVMARLTAIQTQQMGKGTYTGQVFLEDKATSDVSYFANVEVDVVPPVPS